MAKIIGIDLGTTNSVIAYTRLDQDAAQPSRGQIRNDDGEPDAEHELVMRQIPELPRLGQIGEPGYRNGRAAEDLEKRKARPRWEDLGGPHVDRGHIGDQTEIGHAGSFL